MVVLRQNTRRLFFLNAAVKLTAFPFLSVDFEGNEVFCDLTYYIAN